MELRKIYTAPTAEAAFDALATFAASPWGKYPQAARVWDEAWDAFTPFLAFTPAARKLLCTTNSIDIPADYAGMKLKQLNSKIFTHLRLQAPFSP